MWQLDCGSVVLSFILNYIDGVWALLVFACLACLQLWFSYRWMCVSLLLILPGTQLFSTLSLLVSFLLDSFQSPFCWIFVSSPLAHCFCLSCTFVMCPEFWVAGASCRSLFCSDFATVFCSSLAGRMCLSDHPFS